MADITTWANTTLGRLGISKTIGSLSENSVEAKPLARAYAQVRQEVLRAFPWGFALWAEALAEVADQTFPGWTYVYQYPSGCLNMRAVSDESGIRNARNLALCDDWSAVRRLRQPWQKALKSDGASQVLLTDVGTAWGFYTRDVTNVGVWDIDFGSVFSWRWGMEAGPALQAKRDMIDSCEQRYLLWLSQAAANAMNEQKDDAQAEPESIACRR